MLPLAFERLIQLRWEKFVALASLCVDGGGSAAQIVPSKASQNRTKAHSGPAFRRGDHHRSTPSVDLAGSNPGSSPKQACRLKLQNTINFRFEATYIHKRASGEIQTVEPSEHWQICVASRCWRYAKHDYLLYRRRPRGALQHSRAKREASDAKSPPSPVRLFNFTPLHRHRRPENKCYPRPNRCRHLRSKKVQVARFTFSGSPTRGIGQHGASHAPKPTSAPPASGQAGHHRRGSQVGRRVGMFFTS